MVSYSKQTFESSNPLVKYAHHNRLKRARSLLCARPATHHVHDYGCGSGDFLSILASIPGINAVGYEPFMKKRSGSLHAIYSSLSEIQAFAPFDVITVLETVEHLSDHELIQLLQEARSLLHPDGAMLFSAPIEIGPALLMKTDC